jgi:hypothetical protein
MKRLLPILILLALCFGAQAQSPTNRISLSIVVTNRAVTSNTLVINASTRTWTNASSATTIATNLVSTATTATNLYNAIASFSFGSGIFPRWQSETSMVLVAPLGGALAASQSGAWAILTLTTQSGPQTFTALWPIENIAVATNRTNQASAFVGGLSQFSTNAFATNSTASSNFLTKGASPLQTVISPVRFDGRTAVSSNFFATNGFTSALTNINPVTSNLVNFGNSIRSDGPGGNSFQAGSNALALSANTVALGNSSIATNAESTAIGFTATATNKSTAIGSKSSANSVSTAVGYNTKSIYNQATVIGGGAFDDGDYASVLGDGSEAGNGGTALGRATAARGTNSTAAGAGSTIDTFAPYSSALGAGISITHSNSTVIGSFGVSSGSNQIVLGTSTTWVQSPGIFAGNTHSNTTFRGTNAINGRVDFLSRANTGLANGNNAGVILGTNVYVRLSGATTIAYLGGFAAEQDGSFHVLQFTGAITNTFGNESGVDATPANRIITGTGADLSLTNTPLVVGLIYDATAARWRILSFHR